MNEHIIELHKAAIAGDHDKVRTLLEQGIDPDAKLLHDLPEIMKVRNEHGPFGYMTKSRETALHYACELGREEVLKTLLAHGANPMPYDAQNTSPIILALQEQKIDCVKLLLQHPGFDAGWWNTRAGDIVHILASRENGQAGSNESGLTLLLSRGACLDRIDEKGNTPWMTALSSSRINNAVEIIKAGADLHVVNPKTGESFLHFAAKFSSFPVNEIRDQVIASGMDINARDQLGRTPLFTALGANNIDAATAFLDAGADPSLRIDVNEHTIKHLIVTSVPQIGEMKHASAMQYMSIKKMEGFSKISDKDLKRAARILMAYEHMEPAMERMLRPIEPLKAAAMEGLTRQAIKLIGQGHSVEQKYRSGRTLIDIARDQGHEETAMAMASALARKKIADLMPRKALAEPV